MTPDSSPIYPALLAVAAVAPLAGWLYIVRRRRPRHARPNRALAQALAAAVARESEGDSVHDTASREGRRAAKGSPAAVRKAPAADRRRELELALREGPEVPAAGADSLADLREDVLQGLREMKTRVTEFSAALEAGQAALQSELARAERTLNQLRFERQGLEQATALGARRHLDGLSEPELPAAPGLPSEPIAFRPPRLSPAPAGRAPTLDPAWLLLEDDGDEIWKPPVEAAPPRPAAAAARTGLPAVRALAGRSLPVAPATENDPPRERRRRIVEMARNGRTIDEISRELRVGRGEVTLALSRAR